MGSVTFLLIVLVDTSKLKAKEDEEKNIGLWVANYLDVPGS